METIRQGAFETNSSSCHVMTLMSAQTYGSEWPKRFIVDWKRTGNEYDPGAGTILDIGEAVELFQKKMYENLMDHNFHEVISAEDTVKLLSMLCDDAGEDEIRKAIPSIPDNAFDHITSAFADISIDSNELEGGTFVQLGDVVGIVFEKGC